jgi:hypothetical protein
VPERPTYDGASASTTSPGSQKTAGHQVERLLAADGDDDVLREASTPSSAITSQISSRSSGSPCPEPYCSACAPRVCHQLAHQLADDVEREGGQVRHPAGQADHLGPARDGEQGPDLGGRHAVRALRVAVGEGVEGDARPPGSHAEGYSRQGRPGCQVRDGLSLPRRTPYDHPRRSPVRQESRVTERPSGRLVGGLSLGLLLGMLGGWLAGLLRSPSRSEPRA